MGYASVRDFIEAAGERPALRWHLEANLYPPIPKPSQRLFANIAQDAIDAMIEGRGDELNKYRVPYRQVVEKFHLEAFVDARRDAAGGSD